MIRPGLCLHFPARRWRASSAAFASFDTMLAVATRAVMDATPLVCALPWDLPSPFFSAELQFASAERSSGCAFLGRHSQRLLASLFAFSFFFAAWLALLGR